MIPFDDFWKLYPRKVAKKAALKAWSRLPEDLRVKALEGAARYAKQRLGQDPQYTMHPATFLNGERWEDEPDVPPTAVNHADFR